MFDEEDFETDKQVIASGNFGTVSRAILKSESHFRQKNINTSYAGQIIALKDPKGKNHNFLQEQYALSHEISCTVILHPNIVNYIGGVHFEKPQRFGIVMELMEITLRNAIEKRSELKNLEIQISIYKQIASGMNFLHSLDPYVLVK